MSDPKENNDVWQYGSFQGAEKLRRQQERKWTLSQKLDWLDQMIQFSTDIHQTRMVVQEKPEQYGKDSRKSD